MQEDMRIGQTVDEGRIVLFQHLRGEGARRLYLARSTKGPPERFLASLVRMSEHFNAAQFRQSYAYPVPGVLDIAFIGHLDIRGNDFEETSLQQATWALLEKVPEGDWLPTLLEKSWRTDDILALGHSVGEILLRSFDQGAKLGHVRPDYIWANVVNGELRATGLTGRYEYFFHYQTRGSPRTMFSHGYYAPEPHFNDRSLTFTLATMLAEWLTGAFPFPDSWLGNPSLDFLEGRASLNGLPSDLEQVLRRGFTADPAQRPALPEFLEELAGLPA